MRSGLKAIASWLASERQELGILVSTALLVSGIWLWCSPGPALIVAGAIGLWLHLPPRHAFIERRVAAEKGRRET